MLLLGALMSFSRFVPFAVFGLFAAGAWLILEMLASRKPRAQERLDELRYPTARRHADESASPVKKSAKKPSSAVAWTICFFTKPTFELFEIHEKIFLRRSLHTTKRSGVHHCFYGFSDTY